MLFDGPSVPTINVVDDHHGFGWYIQTVQEIKRLKKAKYVVGVPAQAPEQEGMTRRIPDFIHEASWGLNVR